MKFYLQSSHSEVGDVMTFIFTPEVPFRWTAGQAMSFELTTSLGREERWFTISSAPLERHVAVTTRISSSRFKQALARLGVDGVVEGRSAGGEFVWRDEPAAKLFVAGGIGVTPFRSILMQRHHEGAPMICTLLSFYSDEQPLFKDEFIKLQAAHPEFRVIFQKAHMSVEKVKDAVPDYRKMLVYISGPEAAVESVGQQMRRQGLAKDKLLQDWFAGYKPAG